MYFGASGTILEGLGAVQGAFSEVWGGLGAVLGSLLGDLGGSGGLLGWSWGVLVRLSGGRWRYLTPTWHRKATREAKNSSGPIGGTPQEPKNGGQRRPKGAQREAKREPKLIEKEVQLDVDIEARF